MSKSSHIWVPSFFNAIKYNKIILYFCCFQTYKLYFFIGQNSDLGGGIPFLLSFEQVKLVIHYLTLSQLINASVDISSHWHIIFHRILLTSVIIKKFHFCIINTKMSPVLYFILIETILGVVPRWWRNRMGRPSSPPQIHQKNI